MSSINAVSNIAPGDDRPLKRQRQDGDQSDDDASEQASSSTDPSDSDTSEQDPFGQPPSGPETPWKHLSEQDKSEELKWLVTNFAGNSVVRLEFADDPNEYYLPEDVLISHFHYFIEALPRDFDDLYTYQLRKVTARRFARLLRMAVCQPCVYNCENIDDLLNDVVASANLSVSNYEMYWAAFVKRLRELLLENRLSLTAYHVKRVKRHHAFWPTPIYTVLAQAAVRPFLQESMLDLEFKQLREQGKR